MFLAFYVRRRMSKSDALHILAKHCSYKDRHLVGCHATDVLQQLLGLEVEILGPSEMSVELSRLWEADTQHYSPLIRVVLFPRWPLYVPFPGCIPRTTCTCGPPSKVRVAEGFGAKWTHHSLRKYCFTKEVLVSV
jgi:hypothetical protein